VKVLNSLSPSVVLDLVYTHPFHHIVNSFATLVLWGSNMEGGGCTG